MLSCFGVDLKQTMILLRESSETAISMTETKFCEVRVRVVFGLAFGLGEVGRFE